MRAPVASDLGWMIEAYGDWLTREKVEKNLARWIGRSSPVCRVQDDVNGPVGLIVYRQKFFVCEVLNLLVRPHLRNMGWGGAIWRELRNELVAQGVVVARFKTLPGAIRDQLGTRFKALDGFVGELTWDMEI